MKRYLIPLLALLAVGLLTYNYSLMSFLLLFIIGLSSAALFVVGIVKIFKKKLNTQWVSMPFLIVGICLLGIAIGWLRPLRPATINTIDVSKALAHAYETDQGDRKNLKFYLDMFTHSMKMRDSLRLDQVVRLYNVPRIENPPDKFHAACTKLTCPTSMAIVLPMKVILLHQRGWFPA